ncbi:hypothetical protein [Bacillus mojavensis]
MRRKSKAKNQIDKLSMRLGYLEMGAINLEISREALYAENEGEKLNYAMATEKAEGES